MKNKLNTKLFLLSLLKLFAVNAISSLIILTLCFIGIIDEDSLLILIDISLLLFLGYIFNFEKRKEEILAIIITVIYVAMKFFFIYQCDLVDSIFSFLLFSNYSSWIICYTGFMCKSDISTVLQFLLNLITVSAVQFSVLLRVILKKLNIPIAFLDILRDHNTKNG